MNGVETRWGAGSHPGLRRPVNEDSALTAAGLLVVADGMGGHRHGDLASAAVVRAFQPLAGRAPLSRAALEATVAEAHAEVSALGEGVPGGVGSTLACLALVADERGPEWIIANVGDSRVYRYRAGLLEQFSVDHVATVGGARPRSMLTRAMGMAAVLEPVWAADYRASAVVAGDRWLVCSDGLTKELTDAAIAAALATSADPQDVVDGLIDAALAAGGRDNVTVAVLDVLASDRSAVDAATEDTLVAVRRDRR
ncbi:MAG: protein phosphatase 2C domain-containing protein [Propionicimonas sp.]|uniref:PP2C family protein-serine/threonine phosphatase n=1 Tax=Propionicimonas sp. TaxID=1955623 RepID=UPI003D126357